MSRHNITSGAEKVQSVIWSQPVVTFPIVPGQQLQTLSCSLSSTLLWPVVFFQQCLFGQLLITDRTIIKKIIITGFLWKVDLATLTSLWMSNKLSASSTSCHIGPKPPVDHNITPNMGTHFSENSFPSGSDDCCHDKHVARNKRLQKVNQWTKLIGQNPKGGYNSEHIA